MFVNLSSNMLHHTEASILGNAILALDPADAPPYSTIRISDKLSAHTLLVPQSRLKNRRWIYSTLLHGPTTILADHIGYNNTSPELLNNPISRLPITALQAIYQVGPYSMAIDHTEAPFQKPPNRDPDGSQYKALQHQTGKVQTTLNSVPDAGPNLVSSPDHDRLQELLSMRSRLHLGIGLWTPSQALAATITKDSILSFSGWMTLRQHDQRDNFDSAMVLWLNTSVGLLLRMVHANCPYPGRLIVKTTAAKSMPILDFTQLSAEQINVANSLYKRFKDAPLAPLARLAEDRARQELQEEFFGKVLNFSDSDMSAVNELTERLSREPYFTVQPAN